MFNFLTPELFDGLVWAVILIGGALAILRLARDLTGPPRWPAEDDAPDSGRSGGPAPPSP
jgi:hypothetical protein